MDDRSGIGHILLTSPSWSTHLPLLQLQTSFRTLLRETLFFFLLALESVPTQLLTPLSQYQLKTGLSSIAQQQGDMIQVHKAAILVIIQEHMHLQLPVKQSMQISHHDVLLTWPAGALKEEHAATLRAESYNTTFQGALVGA